MKNILFIILGTTFISLSGCNKLPSACEEVWGNIEKLAKESGIPQTAIDRQKIEFEEQIKQLPKEDAIKNCEAQNAFFS